MVSLPQTGHEHHQFGHYRARTVSGRQNTGSREGSGMLSWISNLVFQQHDKQKQASSKGQACLEMLTGVLKIHHFFPRADKIQPRSATAQQLTPHRQQLCLPHTGGQSVGESLQPIWRQKRSSLRAAWLKSHQQGRDAPQEGSLLPPT